MPTKDLLFTNDSDMQAGRVHSWKLSKDTVEKLKVVCC